MFATVLLTGIGNLIGRLDLGASGKDIVAAEVSCQNSGASVTGKWGMAKETLLLFDMPSYI
jgi:hypothetical protein